MAFRNPVRSLPADAITPGTLTGSVVQTSATGRRVVMNPNAIDPDTAALAPALEVHSGSAAQNTPGYLVGNVDNGSPAFPFTGVYAPSLKGDPLNGVPITSHMRLTSPQYGVRGASVLIEGNNAVSSPDDSIGNVRVYGYTAKNRTDVGHLELYCENGDQAAGGNGNGLGSRSWVQLDGAQLILRASTAAVDGIVTLTQGSMASNVPTDAPNYPATGWTSFTPSWTTSTGAQVPSYGNAAVNCAWTRHGRTITARYEIVFGSTTTFGAAPTLSDNWRFGLPVTASGLHQCGGWFELNQGTGTRVVARARFTTTGALELEISSGRPDAVAVANAGLIDGISPWVWTSTGAIRGLISYEAAT